MAHNLALLFWQPFFRSPVKLHSLCLWKSILRGPKSIVTINVSYQKPWDSCIGGVLLNLKLDSMQCQSMSIFSIDGPCCCRSEYLSARLSPMSSQNGAMSSLDMPFYLQGLSIRDEFEPSDMHERHCQGQILSWSKSAQENYQFIAAEDLAQRTYPQGCTYQHHSRETVNATVLWTSYSLPTSLVWLIL